MIGGGRGMLWPGPDTGPAVAALLGGTNATTLTGPVVLAGGATALLGGTNATELTGLGSELAGKFCAELVGVTPDEIVGWLLSGGAAGSLTGVPAGSPADSPADSPPGSVASA